MEIILLEDITGLGKRGAAVRVAPAVARSMWNDGPDDAELVICSIRLEDPRADGELIEDFWPVNGASA